MKIECDAASDALYVQIREARPHDNVDLEDGVTVDLDPDRHIVGLEIPDASKRLSLADLARITIHRWVA